MLGWKAISYTLAKVSDRDYRSIRSRDIKSLAFKIFTEKVRQNKWRTISTLNITQQEQEKLKNNYVSL